VKVYLQRNGLVDKAWLEELDAEAEKLGEHLREGCRAMADPHILDVFGQVFAEQTEELARQQAGYGAYLETFEPEEARA
jgi:pyruvate dehydrogenase E1 component alpha subunit